MAWLVKMRWKNEPTLARVNAAFRFKGTNDHFDMCQGLCGKRDVTPSELERESVMSGTMVLASMCWVFMLS